MREIAVGRFMMEGVRSMLKPSNWGKHGKDLLICWFFPFCIFVLVMVLYTYCFMELPGLCIAATVVGGLGSIVSGSLGIYFPNRSIYISLAASLFSAVVVGTVLGLAFFDRYAIFTMFYENTPLYPSITPYQDVAGVADAGRVVFTSDTSLFTNYSVSYVSEQGYMYCLAPIYDDSPIKRIQFWAAGIGCCDDGIFQCDSAKHPMAHAGIVIFDNNGYFNDHHRKYYDKARVKAQALYSLNSTANPIYVRWVHEGSLGVLKQYYRRRAIEAIFISLVVYLVITGVIFSYFWQPTTPLAGQSEP